MTVTLSTQGLCGFALALVLVAAAWASRAIWRMEGGPSIMHFPLGCITLAFVIPLFMKGILA